MIATVVDLTALLKVVAASLVVGIGITIAFSLTILSSVRVADARRDGRRREIIVFSALGGACLAFTLAAAVLAIAVMASK